MLILQSAYNLTPEEEELAMLMMEMSDDDGDSSKDNLMTTQERADRDPKPIRGCESGIGARPDRLIGMKDRKESDVGACLDRLIGVKDRKMDPKLWEALKKEAGKPSPRCLGCINSKRGGCLGPTACRMCLKRGVQCDVNPACITPTLATSDAWSATQIAAIPQTTVPGPRRKPTHKHSKPNGQKQQQQAQSWWSWFFGWN